MSQSPFCYEAKDARGQGTIQNRNCLNCHLRLPFAISNVKIWRLVVTKIHCDDDAEEARNFWHRTALSKTILQQNQKSGVYNHGMARKIRLFLAIIILTLSLALLLWGIWPNLMETRIVPVNPGQMQLPTPVSFYIGIIS